MFFKGQTRSFVSSWPFIRLSLLCPRGSTRQRESTLRQRRRRKKGRRDVREESATGKKEQRLSDVGKQSAGRASCVEFREWTLFKGKRRMVHPLPLPSLRCQCIVQPDTFHYVPLCPMDILFVSTPSFRPRDATVKSSLARQYFRHRHRYIDRPSSRSFPLMKAIMTNYLFSLPHSAPSRFLTKVRRIPLAPSPLTEMPEERASF